LRYWGERERDKTKSTEPPFWKFGAKVVEKKLKEATRMSPKIEKFYRYEKNVIFVAGELKIPTI